MIMKKFITLLLLVISGTAPLNAQVFLERQVTASAGLSGTIGAVHIQSTLGEAVVSTLKGGDMILTQGFQQPEILFVPLSPVDGDLISGIIIYPNPASVEAHLEFDLLKDSDIQVLLINNAGQVIGNDRLEAVKGRVKHLIPLGGRFAAGMYYVVLKIEYEAHTEKLVVQ